MKIILFTSNYCQKDITKPDKRNSFFFIKNLHFLLEKIFCKKSTYFPRFANHINCLGVIICVCVCEREGGGGEGERLRERERERERESGRDRG